MKYLRAIVKIHSRDLDPKKGRPNNKGFMPSDAVCSFIEKYQRIFFAQGFKKNALQRAKNLALLSFEDIKDLEDPERTIDRDWKLGKTQARALSSECLDLILERHKIN